MKAALKAANQRIEELHAALRAQNALQVRRILANHPGLFVEFAKFKYTPKDVTMICWP